MTKSTFGIIFSRIFGWIIFIVLLGIATYIANKINIASYTSIVSFFHSNMSFLGGMLLLGTVSELFWNFSFPFNIIAPIISGFFGKYNVSFIYQFLTVIGLSSFTDKYPIDIVEMILFWIIIVGGYIAIFFKLSRRNDKKEEEKEIKEDKKNNESEKDSEWKEALERIEDSIKNMGDKIQKAFSKDKEEDKEEKDEEGKERKNKKSKGKK